MVLIGSSMAVSGQIVTKSVIKFPRPSRDLVTDQVRERRLSTLQDTIESLRMKADAPRRALEASWNERITLIA